MSSFIIFFIFYVANKMINLIKITFLFTLNNVFAQSQLPVCPNAYDSSWTNCVGEQSLPNGDKYIGEYIDGKRSGQGIETLVIGITYMGEFKNNEYNGQGTIYSIFSKLLLLILINNKLFDFQKSR